MVVGRRRREWRHGSRLRRVHNGRLYGGRGPASPARAEHKGGGNHSVNVVDHERPQVRFWRKKSSVRFHATRAFSGSKRGVVSLWKPCWQPSYVCTVTVLPAFFSSAS